MALATPAVSHHAMAKAALLAGKDVFVEKPLARDFATKSHADILKHAMRPLSPNEPESERSGWCVLGEPLDVELDRSRVYLDGFLNLGLRTDRWAIPSTVFKTRLREVEAQERARKDRDRLGRNDILSVVSYDDRIDVEVPANKVTNPERIKERIEELRPGLPKDLKIAYVGDQSGFIKASFEAVQEHLILGGILAGIVVLIFMRNWRSTLIAAIAIPTSIIATYTLLNLMGFTLNQITMLALTLMVGIVIDDAIVVLENIFRFMEEKGLPPVQAAIEGTRDIGLAVLATTLSLAVVFLPVAFMTGIVGRFMSSFGFTAAFAIMVSLLVSFTLTPMLCGRFLKLKPNHNPHATKETWIFKIIDRPYQALLRWSMNHRWVIVVLSIVTVLSTGPIFKRVGIDFLPQDDQSEFEITVRMPAGSSVEGTDTMLRNIEADLKTLPGIKTLLTLIGSDARQQVDRGSVLITLVDPKDRKLSQFQIMDQAREMMRKYKRMPIAEMIDVSINAVLPRTLMTATTVFLALLSLVLFGGHVIQGFSLAMMWGLFVAVYSSIFICSPILIYLGVRTDGRGPAGDAAEAAVAKAVDAGIRTGDIMTPGATKVGTAGMGDAILANLG